MVVINYNNDIGDYMEWSGEGLYPVNLTNEAYKLAVNYMIYAMTRLMSSNRMTSLEHPELSTTPNDIALADRLKQGRDQHHHRAAQADRRARKTVDRTGAHRAVRRRQLPHRRRAGPGEDAAHPHAWRRCSISSSRASSSRRT